MRAILFILIVAVALTMVAVGTGFIDIDQTRAAKPPTVSATRKGVTATGGQTPAFDVETGSVKVGTSAGTKKVPSLIVQNPAHDQQAATTNNAM